VALDISEELYILIFLFIGIEEYKYFLMFLVIGI